MVRLVVGEMKHLHFSFLANVIHPIEAFLRNQRGMGTREINTN